MNNWGVRSTDPPHGWKFAIIYSCLDVCGSTCVDSPNRGVCRTVGFTTGKNLHANDLSSSNSYCSRVSSICRKITCASSQDTPVCSVSQLVCSGRCSSSGAFRELVCIPALKFQLQRCFPRFTWGVRSHQQAILARCCTNHFLQPLLRFWAKFSLEVRFAWLAQVLA